MKRPVPETVTRMCYARCTYVLRVRHVRVTPVTRTCYSFCIEELYGLFLLIQIYMNIFIQFLSVPCPQSIHSPFIRLPAYVQNCQIKITQLILYIIFKNFTTFVVIKYLIQNE